MAVDKQQALKFIDSVESSFEEIAGRLGGDTKQWLKEAVFGPAMLELEDLVKESRPPIIYTIGRSGHGKSSLINALVGRQVAHVNAVRPETPQSKAYRIEFPESYSTWDLMDSRGIFESAAPTGALSMDTVELLKREVERLKPDVILHVLAAQEIRASERDLLVINEIRKLIKATCGGIPPVLLVLTKVDLLGNPRHWPPEQYSSKSELIERLLAYASTAVLKGKMEAIDEVLTIKGYKPVDSLNETAGLIPVCSLENELWNIDTLLESIGTTLPKSARLFFFQAGKRKKLLKSISSSIIKRFATAATVIGTSPIPISDIVVLTPLQMLMIAFVGGLSCRSFSKETAMEFLAAGGITLGAGFGLRILAQQALKFIPLAGWAVSGAVAGAATYGIGKAAETFFFSGEIVDPTKFKNEWKEVAKQDS